jgi:hypothetical protein
MAEKEDITQDELEQIDGELLPDRKELAIISDPLFGGLTIPVEAEPPATK